MTTNEYLGCCVKCSDKVFNQCGGKVGRFWMEICEKVVCNGFNFFNTHQDLFLLRKLELINYLVTTEVEKGVRVKPKGLRVSDDVVYFCLDDSHGK